MGLRPSVIVHLVHRCS